MYPAGERAVATILSLDVERTLKIPHPLDLRLTLGPLAHGTADPCIRSSQQIVWRAARTPEGPVCQSIKRTAEGVEATAWGHGAAWSLEQLPELLGAADDPEDFKPEDRCLRNAARRAPGLRMCRSRNIFEILIPTILEQLVTGEEARRSWRSLVKAYGEPAPGPASLWLPPSPERLAALPYFDFHPHGIERKRATAIKEACKRATQMQEAAGMDSDSAARRLLACPGIGPWTTAIVLQVALGDPDAVVVGDFHLPNVVAWALAGEARATDARMLELLAPYRGHRGRAVRLIGAAGIWAPKFGPRARICHIAAI